MHLNDDELILHFYGEGDRSVREHLLDCAECRGRTDETSRFLRGIGDEGVPEPEQGWEREVWARLEPSLRPRNVLRWRRWAAVAAVLAVTFLGGLLTRDLLDRRSESAPGASLTSDESGRDRIFLMVVSDHFERTERVLLELTNLDDHDSLNEDQRVAAEDLLETNRMYRLSAQQNGDGRIGELLKEIEPVLLELVRNDDANNRESLESLRDRVDQTELLFRVRVVNGQLRSEGASRPGPRTSI